MARSRSCWQADAWLCHVRSTTLSTGNPVRGRGRAGERESGREGERERRGMRGRGRGGRERRSEVRGPNGRGGREGKEEGGRR
eukprot:2933302-Rhodomonas_salina.1